MKLCKQAAAGAGAHDRGSSSSIMRCCSHIPCSLLLALCNNDPIHLVYWPTASLLIDSRMLTRRGPTPARRDMAQQHGAQRCATTSKHLKSTNGKSVLDLPARSIMRPSSSGGVMAHTLVYHQPSSTAYKQRRREGAEIGGRYRGWREVMSCFSAGQVLFLCTASLDGPAYMSLGTQ